MPEFVAHSELGKDPALLARIRRGEKVEELFKAQVAERGWTVTDGTIPISAKVRSSPVPWAVFLRSLPDFRLRRGESECVVDVKSSPAISKESFGCLRFHELLGIPSYVAFIPKGEDRLALVGVEFMRLETVPGYDLDEQNWMLGTKGGSGHPWLMINPEPFRWLDEW